MGIYDEFNGLRRLTIKERTKAFKETSLELLQKGTGIEEMKVACEGFKDDEMYEAAQGVLNALKEFDKNPQMLITY